jgi:putative transposase
MLEETDRRHGGSGHVWQGRFKAFPIQEDEHLLMVLRYVERNPLRAGLVVRAGEWPWSSLGRGSAVDLDPGPVPRGPGWAEAVDRPMYETETEVERVRHSLRRGAPLGTEEWAVGTAARLGLESSLRARGRPRTLEG